MKENQLVKKESNKHTNASRAALNAMQKQLARRSVYWKSVCDEVNGGLPHSSALSFTPCNHNKTVFRLPETELVSLLLTPKQVEGLETVQRLCEGIGKLQQQLNTVLITHELNLPKVALVELSDLLLKSDRLIMDSRCAAHRLGIAEVQPKVKRDFLDKFLGLTDWVYGNGKKQRAEKVRA